MIQNVLHAKALRHKEINIVKKALRLCAFAQEKYLIKLTGDFL
jgi:hypothetical protein